MGWAKETAWWDENHLSFDLGAAYIRDFTVSTLDTLEPKQNDRYVTDDITNTFSRIQIVAYIPSTVFDIPMVYMRWLHIDVTWANMSQRNH